MREAGSSRRSGTLARYDDSTEHTASMMMQPAGSRDPGRCYWRAYKIASWDDAASLLLLEGHPWSVVECLMRAEVFWDCIAAKRARNVWRWLRYSLQGMEARRLSVGIREVGTWRDVAAIVIISPTTGPFLRVGVPPSL